MLEAGIDSKKASHALGHTTMGMTQRYLRSNEGEADVVYAKLFEHRARSTRRSTGAAASTPPAAPPTLSGDASVHPREAPNAARPCTEAAATVARAAVSPRPGVFGVRPVQPARCEQARHPADGHAQHGVHLVIIPRRQRVKRRTPA